NARKETRIDTKVLSEKLGCPVVETTATSAQGLSEVVKTAASLKGKEQKAPYTQGDIDLTSKEAVVAADRQRFEFVNGIVSKVEKRKVLTKNKNAQDKIDDILTNRYLGIPIFAVVMFLVFQISQAWVGPYIADTLVAWLETFQEWVGGLVENAAPILQALLVDGVIGGVIAVIGFLPLVMVMYFLISLLEDCGYMARATVVLDPIFKKVGLSGKSVIPFVIGTGCAIPGVMACRTIRNERERRATAMLAPFMPCGAKLPVIGLFAGAFFADASWVGTLMYFVGILLILLGALLVNKVTGHKARKSFFIIELPEYKAPSLKRAFLDMCSRGWAYIVKAGTIILLCSLLVNKIAGHKNRKSFFIIELPEYKLPSLKRAFLDMCSRGWAYIVKAGTIILLCNAVVYIMQSFGWNMQLVEEGAENTSILATIAAPFAYALIPVIGIHAWQMAAAAVTGFIAKENVVGTLAVCYGISNLIDTEELALAEGAGTEVAAVFAITKVAALAYLMFNLFSPPCFAAIGAMNAEIKEKKWLWGGIGL
ncbi:MAG: ferrous iron transporter B, partial [Clostridia bacterium]|nr:ferrous iron transporter B [Clostridia bacterium]